MDAKTTTVSLGGSVCDGDKGMLALAEARTKAERALRPLDEALAGLAKLRLAALGVGAVNAAGDALLRALLEERTTWQERWDAADAVLAQSPHERGACACYQKAVTT